MAVDLVLRLCQVDEDDGGFPPDRHIAIDDWSSALNAVHGGYHTATQIKAFFDMTTEEQSNFDTLWAEIAAGGVNLVKQRGRIERSVAILMIYARRDDLNVPTYDTPDKVQTQLLAISDGFL